MPVYTNRHNLPDAFYRAVVADPYSRGESDFSATSLQQPPRAFVLQERHGPNLEIDISTRVAAILGQGTHSILERSARPSDIFEKRFFANFLVDEKIYIVSAQVDLYESDIKSLSDWKTCKAYAFHKKSGAGKKPEWEQQLNVGAYLMRQNGHEVRSAHIIGLLKDWDERKAKSEPGYPPTEIMTVEIELWPNEKTALWISERIMAIVKARNELPKCSSKETWGGNRCSRWCDVSSVCDQYQSAKQTGVI